MADPAALIDRQKLLANSLAQGWPNLNIPALPWVSCAAVIGNGTQENQCKSVTTGALDHGSNGFLQWRDSGSGSAARLTNMQTWTTANFGTWESLPAQAAFFAHECMTLYQKLWADLVAGAEKVETLTLNITDAYERPSDAGRVPDTRIGYAKAFLAAAPAPGSAPLPQPAPIPAPAPAPPIYVPMPLPAPGGAFTLSPAIIALIEQQAPAVISMLMPWILKILSSPAVETAAVALLNNWAQQLAGGTTLPAGPAPALAVPTAAAIAQELLPLVAPALAAMIPANPVVTDLEAFASQLAPLVAKQLAPPTTGAKAA